MDYQLTMRPSIIKIEGVINFLRSSNPLTTINILLLLPGFVKLKNSANQGRSHITKLLYDITFDYIEDYKDSVSR